MSTAGASLRSVARVDALNPTSLRFRLVLQESSQLCEGPGVQAATGFPAALFDTAADMLEILNDDHCAELSGLNDTPTENVVAIAAEAVNLPGQLAKMPFGRAGAFRLKCALQSEVPAVYFPPVFGSRETIVGTDGGTGKTHVHADDIARWLKLHVGEFNGDMQEPAATAEDQISRKCAAADVFRIIRRECKRDSDSSASRRKSHGTLVPLDSSRVVIVPGRTLGSCGAGYLAPLLAQCEGAAQGFRGLDPSLYHKIGNQSRTCRPDTVIRQVVQADTILLVGFPTSRTSCVKGIRKLCRSLGKSCSLVQGWVEHQTNRSVHISSVPYTQTFCKKERREGAFTPGFQSGVPCAVVYGCVNYSPPISAAAPRSGGKPEFVPPAIPRSPLWRNAPPP